MTRGRALDDDAEARLAAIAAQPERSWGSAELDELSPLFDALALRDRGHSEDVSALSAGLADTLDEGAARALTEGATSAAEVSERFSRLRALVAAHDALGSPRARGAAPGQRG